MWESSELGLVVLLILSLLLLLVLSLALVLAVLGIHAAVVLLVFHGILTSFPWKTHLVLPERRGDYTPCRLGKKSF